MGKQYIEELCERLNDNVFKEDFKSAFLANVRGTYYLLSNVYCHHENFVVKLQESKDDFRLPSRHVKIFYIQHLYDVDNDNIQVVEMCNEYSDNICPFCERKSVSCEYVAKYLYDLPVDNDIIVVVQRKCENNFHEYYDFGVYVRDKGWVYELSDKSLIARIKTTAARVIKNSENSLEVIKNSENSLAVNKINVEDVLKERGKTYGDYSKLSKFNKELIQMFESKLGHPLSTLNPEVSIGLFMVLHKLSRIANNPNHKDSWVDIAGYSTLVSNSLE